MININFNPPPKLRIPDIYENSQNQKAFGRFLKAYLETNSTEKGLEEIQNLDRKL